MACSKLGMRPNTIVLVGITGEGKSTTGNTICGDASAFKTSSRMRSETQACSHYDFEYAERAYRVIDTIGLQDTNLNPSELHTRFRAFADLAPGGVDAFCFVIKQGRFRPESFSAFATFLEACTEAALKHSMIVVTNAEEYFEGEETDYQQNFLKSFLSEAESIPNLYHCLKQVNQRVVGVENKPSRPELKEQGRKAILEMVQSLMATNGQQPYKNDCLREAEAWRAGMEAKAQGLRCKDHSAAVMKELNELIQGRRTRAEVEAELKKLQDKEAQLRAAEEKAAREERARAEAERQRDQQRRKAEEERDARERERQRAVCAERELERRRKEEKEELEEKRKEERKKELRRREWSRREEFRVGAGREEKKVYWVESGDRVQWSYQLKVSEASHDIAFAIYFRAQGSSESMEWCCARSTEDRGGTEHIPGSGELIFVFGNKHSIFTGKTVQFQAVNRPT